MAENVDKTPAGGALDLGLLSMSESEKKEKQARAAPPLPAVREVVLWTLFHAAIVTVSSALGTAAYTLIVTSISRQLLPRSVEVTDDEVDKAGALAAGMLWCAVCLAAAWAAALILPYLRRLLRLLQVYAALVGGFVMFVAAGPGVLCFTTGVAIVIVVIFILGVGVLGLIILRVGEEEKEE